MSPAFVISRLPEPLAGELQVVLPMLRRMIRRVSGATGEGADDVLQELLVQALIAVPRFRNKCKMSAFLAAVMRNRANELCRYRRLKFLPKLGEEVSPLPGPELLAVARSFAEDVENNWPPYAARGIRRALESNRKNVHFSTWMRMYGEGWT